ncbi:MAG: hypothetical protein ACPGWR_33130 [Ardenticatenaceae bacterium]
MGNLFQHASDPWWIAMAITLVLMTILTGYILRGSFRDWLILAYVFPQALFKKVFGDPPQH